MSEQNNAEEILSILENMYQEMVDSKSCHICKYHTDIPVLRVRRTEMTFETYVNNSIVPIRNQTDFTQYVRYILSRQHYGKSRKYRRGV